MLYQKLLLFEQRVLSQKLLLKRKMKVLDGIKLLLSQLDLSAEFPNSREFEQICELLKDLKGEALTDEEQTLIKDVLGAEQYVRPGEYKR